MMKVKSLITINYNDLFIIKLIIACLLSIIVTYISFAYQRAIQDLSGKIIISEIRCEKNILMMEWHGWYLSGKSPILDKNNNYQKCK